MRKKLKYVTIITYWLQAMAKLRIWKCIQTKTQPERIQYLLQNLLGFQFLAALEQDNVGFYSFSNEAIYSFKSHFNFKI